MKRIKSLPEDKGVFAKLDINLDQGDELRI